MGKARRAAATAAANTTGLSQAPVSKDSASAAAAAVAATPWSNGRVATDHQPKARNRSAKAEPQSVVATKNEHVPTTLFRRHLCGNQTFG